jgi:glycosyltransferase involved in cell wall biosynthesis
MHVYWFTARSFNDLCSTTQRALMQGLLDRGYKLSLINPDQSSPFQHELFGHRSLPLRGLRGFKASSLAASMVGWLRGHRLTGTETVALVEWRVAAWVGPELERMGVPWMLVDRSPPADDGLLAWLQWRSWRKAWRIAKRYGRQGCVTSVAHAAFVGQQTGHFATIPLEAGVDLRLFQPGVPRERLTMVYHGRLDRHRGVLAAVMLTHKAMESGLDVGLVFVGEGNVKDQLHDIGQSNPNIEVHSTTDQASLAALLGTCHVGLLPMPATRVWKLASPLKRSEYLASGLSVFGIDHEGHRLPNTSELWMKLVPQESFLSEGVVFLQTCIERREEARLAARNYAEEHHDWSIQVNRLAEAIQNLNNAS